MAKRTSKRVRWPSPGEQVRNAVDVFVRCLDRIDFESAGKLLPRNSVKIYEAGLTVALRLVFILYAEQRGLLPPDDPSFAASKIREELRETADRRGGEILERRRDAWPRLLSRFRSVHGVVGGDLFDPDRFPFLEGRSVPSQPRRPLPIDDRIVLHLLQSCQVSDVEQIGHVYEDSLEYTVRRLDEITLGLDGARSAKDPNVSLAELESAASDGKDSLVALLREYTHKKEAAVRKALAEPLPPWLEARLESVCSVRKGLSERMKPFGNLLRTDALGDPVVYEEGFHAIVSTSNRRETGTHYTPKSLAEKIVDATLEPLLRAVKSHEILSLKICDPAMGSGAFLVQACRRLGARLVEAWNVEGKPDVPAEPGERLREAMRRVSRHCLYGVDIDPTAVELAKLSIRLVTESKDRARENPDLNFRCADSLVSLDWPAEFPEVFEGGGFDAVIGNPPFLGGRKMRGVLGESYLRRLLETWPHASLNSDLCAFFFLQASRLLRTGGSLGFLATDTVGQGDTARTGLRHIIETENLCIRHACSSFLWPGKAAVRAAWVVLHKGDWPGPRVLDGRDVDRITAILDDGDRWEDAHVFGENMEINFQGSVFAGKGFVLTKEEAESFLRLRKENGRVIFPFLGGNDLNTSPCFEASRRAVDFRDFPLERCEKEWPELLERIRALVKPERDKARRDAHRKYWWHHGDKRPALYDRIRKNDFVFALVRHSKYLALARVSTKQVFQESLCLLDLPNWTAFAAIQSTLHYVWARRGSSTLGEGLRYTPSDYFDTFPFLHLSSPALETLGEEYYVHRAASMLEFGVGLTEIYNRFHMPEEKDARIVRLRDLHRRMDEAVAAAYGWADLELDHDFHPVGYLPVHDRTRFTIGEKGRLEILRRLAKLNRERYEEQHTRPTEGDAAE